MPIQKDKSQQHVLVRGPLARRDVTWLHKYNDQQVLTFIRIQSDSLDFIADWSNLRSLRLYGSKIGDYSALTKLKRLEDLFLNGTRSRETDWSFLSQLVHLKFMAAAFGNGAKDALFRELLAKHGVTYG